MFWINSELWFMFVFTLIIEQRESRNWWYDYTLARIRDFNWGMRERERKRAFGKKYQRGKSCVNKCSILRVITKRKGWWKRIKEFIRKREKKQFMIGFC